MHQMVFVRNIDTLVWNGKVFNFVKNEELDWILKSNLEVNFFIIIIYHPWNQVYYIYK